MAEATRPLQRRLDIDVRQAESLEAIAFAANVVDFVYRRLLETLPGSPEDGQVPIEGAFADAWTMIDWLHRIDGLVRDCRGVSERSVEVRDFLNGSSLVETHRHLIQHPQRSLAATSESGRSSWGHIAWISNHKLEGQAARWVLVPSVANVLASEPRMPTFENPRGRIDWISLYSPEEEAEISLTGQDEALLRFITKLGRAVEASPPPIAGGILKVTAWPTE